MIISFGNKKAHTLSELIVVMLIIAVVVSVSIKITKARFDSLVAYTYYAAYETLSTVTGEIMATYMGEDKTEAEITNGCQQYQYWDATENKCKDMKTSLPQNGNKFCTYFEEIVNIKSENCSGTNTAQVATAVNNKKFKDLTPDLILKNGIRLYNLKNDPVNIPQLAGNAPIAFVGYDKNFFLMAKTFFDSMLFNKAYAVGDDVLDFNNLSSRGYIVYADINGLSGDSVLYEDVFPFYITLSGTVIPGYDEAVEAGGNSNVEMAVSVSYDDYSSGNRQKSWLVKSKSFQEAACKAGYVTALSYCGNYSVDTLCNDLEKDCRVVPVKPLRK